MKPSKLSQLKDAWRRADFLGALRIASKFQNLGRDKEDIQRGWEALQRPKVYRQMGQDPDELIAIAYIAIERRYGLGEFVDA